ncbi:PREDICTED: uncharacterized protein LOC107340861 [Acropora digitifera]|uniref:uncharacterized protein LOC107340861 n=1 Tax=Acropora digitifera TaxID=70779 RepID=UPI00077A81E9|nr:PREDICTED: uncharacterized protein LOC107340861 [Acropora digitifera]
MMDERSTASARKYNKYKGRYCVAGYKNQISCKNTSYTHGVTIHQFPCDPETRAKWTKFVQKHRPDFQAPPERRNIAMCSAHFKDECFNKPRLSLNDLENIKFQRRQLKGSVPTEDVRIYEKDEAFSARDQRHLRRTVLFDNFGAVPVPTKKRWCEPTVVNNVEMSSADIVGIEMDSSDVAGVVMDSSDVVGVEMDSSDVVDAEMDSSDVVGIEMDGSDVVGIEMDGSDVVGIEMDGSDVVGIEMDGSDVVGIEMDGSDVVGIEMDGSDVVGIEMDGSDVVGIEMDGSDVVGIEMDGSDVVGIEMDGSDVVGIEMDGSDVVGIEMDGSDVVGAEMDHEIVTGHVSVDGGNKRKIINYQMKCKNLTRANRRLKLQVCSLKTEIKTLKKQLSYIDKTQDSGEEDHIDAVDHAVDAIDNLQAHVHRKSDENSAYYVWSTEGSEDEVDHQSEKEEWKADIGSDETNDETEDDLAKESCDKDVKVDRGTPVSKEPKFIVFYGMLLSLFNLFCFDCKAEKPKVTMKKDGTMVTVYQECNHCINGFTWRSQPGIFGRFPAGNILLSFGTLLAGASISKVILIFRHMGLCAYSPRTFFRHQRMFIIPSILKYWETYRNSLIDLAKQTKDVVWCGDARFDSMGHCAKYGVYTFMSTTLMKIVHFELVQSNETNGANQTELEGLKRCFKFMEQAGVPVKTFISDRHRGNAKWIREAKTQTVHYYDIWHVARSLWKKLLKASKEGGCEKISSWMKGIRRHLYWCATSTKPGFGALIVAKWSSFLRHVANIHSDHPNELYKKCHHEPLQDRLWIKRGTAAHDKLKNVLLNKTLLKDIANLSPEAQTSSLENFHATLNHWHPKMLGFSFLGSWCRLVI